MPYRTQVAVESQIARINGKTRDELQDKEVYYRLLEGRVLSEGYRLTKIQV